MRRWLILALLCVPLAAQGPTAAIQAELERAKKELAKLDPPPYFVGYSISDVETISISASNGALESVARNRARWLDVTVRVGSYDLDNTHRVPGETGSATLQLPRRGPFDGPSNGPSNDDAVLRRALWRATDRAYKDAARQYLRVKTARNVRVAAEDNSPDFSRPEPQAADARNAAPASLGENVASRIEKWKADLRAYSERFRRERHILNSHVTLAIRASTRYVVTSDGVRSVQPQVLYRLGLLAEGKADDGMDLNRFESFEARSAAELPAADQVIAKIEKVSAEVKALQKAAVLEPYSGPAILSGRAAAVFFHEALGHRVEGHRQRDQDQGQTFTRKVGERILPAFLSVYDDPTTAQTGKTPLMGAYNYDDEGVAVHRVNVAENGVLKNFLLSRTPVQGFAASNGHGRGEPGQTPVGRQGNLFVTSSESVPPARLRQMLIDEVKRRGKPYGLLFGEVEGGYTLTHRFSAQVFQVFPLMVWRIYPDGRPDELVRGAELVGTPLVTLEKIAAAGDDPQVFNGYCGAESGYVPVSAVAPSLLISEMEVQKKAKASDLPPVLSPPAAPSPDPKKDAVLAAMSDELERNAELRLGDLDRPYYLEYRLADLHRIEIAASLGALTESSDQSYRPLTAGVRVGSYALDNTNFSSAAEPGAGTGGAEQYSVSLDPNYQALRQDLWIGTDLAYKRALSSFAAKEAYLNTTDRDDTLPDFGKAAPRTLIQPAAVDRDASACREMAKRLSARFAGKNALLDSSLRISVTTSNRYFANSEGTRLRRPEILWTLRASATALAADGIRLRGGFNTIERVTGELPCGAADERAVAQKIDSAIQDLQQASSAPRGQEYLGPVLVEAPAAAAIFAALLPSSVAGNRTPLTDNALLGDSGDQNSPSLNARILPRPFEVVDTPEPGQIDDEGVPAVPVRVIERGILKRQLASRTPVRGAPESNGHGRATPGGAAMAAPTNLAVRTEGALSWAELKERLLALCRERGLEYGLVIRRFQAVSADELSPDDLSDPAVEGVLAGPMRGASPLQPLSVWKVYTSGGREEQVRGLRLVDLRLGSLKTLLAAGSDRAAYSGFFSPQSQFSFGVTALGGAAEGPPFTVTAPSVLFDELEFRLQRRATERGPSLTPP